MRKERREDATAFESPYLASEQKASAKKVDQRDARSRKREATCPSPSGVAGVQNSLRTVREKK